MNKEINRINLDEMKLHKNRSSKSTNDIIQSRLMNNKALDITTSEISGKKKYISRNMFDDFIYDDMNSLFIKRSSNNLKLKNKSITNIYTRNTRDLGLKTNFKESFSDKVKAIIGDFRTPKKYGSKKRQYEKEFNEDVNRYISRKSNSNIKPYKPSRVLSDINNYSNMLERQLNKINFVNKPIVGVDKPRLNFSSRKYLCSSPIKINQNNIVKCGILRNYSHGYDKVYDYNFYNNIKDKNSFENYLKYLYLNS